MILKQYYLGCLAHASYLLGDEATSTAIIVDRQRDIHQYLVDAGKFGLEIRQLGHVRNAHEGQFILAPDLKETLAAVDQFEIDALRQINDYISRVGLAAPTENIPRLLDGYKEEEMTELNLQGLGVSTVVWATGYGFDFSLVKLPVVDSDGYPIQKRGVTRYPGLYFLGLPWLYNQRSGILFGVGDDAAYLAAHIAALDSHSSRVLPFSDIDMRTRNKDAS
jgi:cation diffusion facilitator CzcD-associated flavoprotein CzcO